MRKKHVPAENKEHESSWKLMFFLKKYEHIMFIGFPKQDIL